MLNTEQLNAVNTVSGPVLVIAGPGTGKTMVLTNRIHHMISDLSINPESILVVTFSRAAAVNMKKRYLSISSNTNTNVTFGTFHSIFFHFLKAEYHYESEDILSGNASLKLLMSFLTKEQAAIGSNLDFVAEIASEIALVKSRKLSPSDYVPKSITKEMFQDLFARYNSFLESNHKLDFEDILIKTHELLINNPTLAINLSNKYKYILVDEFQDINHIQYEIVKLLATPQNNLFVVGDDDQAIYSFRGASPSIMKRFTDDYSDCKIIHLNTNYRSTDAIIKGALQVIGVNQNRFEKNLTSVTSGGEQISISSFESYEDEISGLAKAIKALIKKGCAPQEIAVLLRTQSEVLTINAALSNHGINSQLKLSNTLYQNKHVIPVIAMLKFAKGETTRENLLHFYNKPQRYIKRDYISEPSINLDALLATYTSNKQIYVANSIKKMIFDLNIIKSLDPASAIHYIRKVAGYESYLKSEARLSLHQLDETTSILSLIEKEARKFNSLSDFLTFINSNENNSSTDSEASNINIITAHASKGLEFEYVFILNCIEGNFPHKRSTTFEEIEEERRMFYVAMTRAKKGLTLSFSESSSGRDNRVCSRFVLELLESMPLPQPGTTIIHNVYKKGTIIYAKDNYITVKFDDILVPKILNYPVCLRERSITFYSFSSKLASSTPHRPRQ